MDYRFVRADKAIWRIVKILGDESQKLNYFNDLGMGRKTNMWIGMMIDEVWWTVGIKPWRTAPKPEIYFTLL